MTLPKKCFICFSRRAVTLVGDRYVCPSCLRELITLTSAAIPGHLERQ